MRFLMPIFIAMFCLLSTTVAIAQDAAAATIADATAVASELGFLDDAMKFLDSVEMGGWLVGLTVVIELLFRFIKTDKPKSVVYLVADGCRMIGTIMGKVAELLDKILPQRTKV